MAIDLDGKVAWSEGFRKAYPSLHRQWYNCIDRRYIKQITLGTHNHWVIDMSRSMQANLDAEMCDELNSCQSEVKVCALGRHGTYIFVTDREAIWNLKGLYGGLDDWIGKRTGDATLVVSSMIHNGLHRRRNVLMEFSHT
jgi:hypothetical protein